MNVLEKYKTELYDENEYSLLDRYIKIVKHDEYNGYFYDNSLSFNSDFAYAELLGIDITAYRHLIYNNCLTTDSNSFVAKFFKDFKEASVRKKVLIFLLLSKYKTKENAIRAMINIKDKK